MSELLVLFAIGVFMWLLNVFLTAWRTRRQRQAAPNGGLPVSPVRPRARSLQAPVGVARASIPAGERVAPPASARGRMGSLREIRRGIVLMTILGPCRSLERPDPPQ